MMDAEERKHIQEKLHEHYRRLRLLEVRYARKGINADPEDINEIEDIQRTIEALEEELLMADARRVHLITYKDIEPLPNQDYVLDWSMYYPVPASEQWETILFPDLLTFRRLRNQQATLLVQANAYLSAGMAFGYAFHNRQNFKLWIE